MRRPEVAAAINTVVQTSLGPNSRGYRWLILALLWLLYVSFGLVFRSIFPLVTPILRDLDISYTQMGLILGSWQLTYIPAALVAGLVLDRWGVRKSIFAGAAIIGLSGTLRYFPNGFPAMLIVVALFGAGGPMISIGGPKTISEWFEGKSRGTAIGLYMTGQWIGSFLALALTNSLVMPLVNHSWRLTFACYGMLAFSGALLWWWFGPRGKPPSYAEDITVVQVFRGLVTIRKVRILLVMGLFSFAVGHGFSSWLPKILEVSGLSASQAGVAASIPIATGIPALLLIPRKVPASLRNRCISIFALITTVNLIAAIMVSGVFLIAVLMILGFFSATFFPLLILILLDCPQVEQKYLGAAGGMLFCVAEIGGFTGPLLMGLLVDITGAFLIGVFFLACLCIAISAMAFYLRDDPLPKIETAKQEP